MSATTRSKSPARGRKVQAQRPRATVVTPKAESQKSAKTSAEPPSLETCEIWKKLCTCFHKLRGFPKSREIDPEAIMTDEYILPPGVPFRDAHHDASWFDRIELADSIIRSCRIEIGDEEIDTWGTISLRQLHAFVAARIDLTKAAKKAG